MMHNCKNLSAGIQFVNHRGDPNRGPHCRVTTRGDELYLHKDALSVVFDVIDNELEWPLIITALQFQEHTDKDRGVFHGVDVEMGGEDLKFVHSVWRSEEDTGVLPRVHVKDPTRPTHVLRQKLCVGNRAYSLVLSGGVMAHAILQQTFDLASLYKSC